MTHAKQYDDDLRILVNAEKLGFARAEAFLDINTWGAPSVTLEKLGARRKGSGGFNLTIEGRYRCGAKHSQGSGAEDCLRPPLAMASV